jgi:hypothetical protein
MRWKLFTAAALGALLMCVPTAGNVYAADYTAYEEYEKAIGLIEKCTLTCSATEGGVIYITAKTQVSSAMEEVGYKNITIQHSDDGVNWNDEQVINDLTKSNVRYYNINNLKVQAKGTGYYRVVCVHYAKGVPFGEDATQIQTAINTSAASYLKPPSSPVTTAKVTTSSSTTSARTTATSAKNTSSTTRSGSSTAASSGSASSTTSAAVTTTKSGSSGSQAPKTDSPSTGSKAPLGAAVMLIGSGAAAWIMRRKDQ